MSRPSQRLFAFLELLQSRPGCSARAAAAELGVAERTVRRYVQSLGELGIPVDGAPGVGGGYRLRPASRLPPLMLTDDEATATAYGLLLAERRGLGGAAGASAKLGRVLPRHLAARVERLRDETVLAGEPDPPPVSGETLLVLAEAVRRHRSLTLRYAGRDGEEQLRTIDPYGLVARRGRWYVPALDRRSGELRTFRADRVRSAALGDPAPPPQPGFDPDAHVVETLASIPARWQVEVLLHAPLAEVRPRVPETLATLAAAGGDRTRLTLRAESLDWAAALLAGLGVDLTVVAPRELRDELARLARRLTRAAAGS